MPAIPETDWTHLGWKIWYYIDDQIVVYSSKTHTWDQLPQNGAQKMFRYYSRPVQVENRDPETGYPLGTFYTETRKWKESIAGQDFYLECCEDKDLLPSSSATFKIGELHTCVHDAIDAARADTTYPVDNSIARYIDPNKTLVGWTAWVCENHVAVKYESSNTAWADLPMRGLLRLNKYWQSGTDFWIEQVGNQDVFYLDDAEQTNLLSTYTFLKNGSVITTEKLEEINLLTVNDTEEF